MLAPAGKGGLTGYCSVFVPISLCQYFVFDSFIAPGIKAQLLTLAKKGARIILTFFFCTDLYKWGTQAFLEMNSFLALLFSSSKIKEILDKMYLFCFCQQRAIVRAGWVTKKCGSSKNIHILITALTLQENGKRLKDPNAWQGAEGRGLCPSPKTRHTHCSTKLLPWPGQGFRIALTHNYLPLPPAHPLPTINC